MKPQGVCLGIGIDECKPTPPSILGADVVACSKPSIFREDESYAWKCALDYLRRAVGACVIDNDNLVGGRLFLRDQRIKTIYNPVRAVVGHDDNTDVRTLCRLPFTGFVV